MPLKIVTRVLLFFLFATHGAVYAQGAGGSLISYSWGIGSIDELKGVTNTSYMDIPFAFTGASFLSYRYFITDRFAVGFSAGMDDVKGNLTYGNPNLNSTGMEGTTGTYIRHAYSFGPEVLVKYYDNGRMMLYGYLGIGYTFSKVEKAYNTQIYANAYQNGVNPNPGSVPNYVSATNPLYVTENHPNAQLTAFGLRVGRTVGWYFELGFGYKGAINTGLSVKL